MDFLYQNLPKDLVYIIEEYAKDRTNYDKVMKDIYVLNCLANRDKYRDWYRNWNYSRMCLSWVTYLNSWGRKLEKRMDPRGNIGPVQRDEPK